ncbi:surface protein SP1 [Apiospora arundinis]|uniref:Surface protein SP1 n=1 Tax=Apiospora arundinis TaxID=335852 RepID=A0ABR2JIP5_9PEZI
MYFNQAIAVAILAYTAAAAPAGPNCDRQDSICRKYTANNGLSAVECEVSVAQCIGSCQVSFDRCSTAPNANHATCVAQLVGCTGKSIDASLKPQSATGDAVYQPAAKTKAAETSCVLKDDACRTAPGANQAECSAQKAECKDQCSSAADACRTAPGANQSLCSADYAKCLGENPYAKRGEEPHWETGDAVYFPAKNSKAAEKPHFETGDAVYFPAPKEAKTAEEPHWETGDAVYFPAPKDAKRAEEPHWETGDAVYFPAKDSKVAEKPHFETGDAVYFPAQTKAAASSCVLKDDACRTAPGANQSLCSAEKAACKTTCLADADACRVAPGANQSLCSADYAKCLGENPYAKKRGTPQASAGTPVYQGNCEQLDTVCRTAPGANMAQCSAEQAACKATCQSVSDVCRTAPGANQAQCSAEFAECLGTNPYN